MPSMRLFALGLLLLISLSRPGFAIAASGNPGRGEKPDRIARIRVLDPSGHPVPGRLVLTRGVSRSWFSQVKNEKRDRHLTARNGGFLVRFGPFDAFDPAYATTTTLGWGGYYFIVPPGPDDAGGVSDYIYNPRESGDAGEGRPANEWGQTRRLGDRTLDVTIHLKKGIAVDGRVLDQAGQPVGHTSITLYHDLHADTHTGYGGEIFERSVLTDSQGRYHFDKVYPATFKLGTNGLYNSPKRSTNPSVWLRTRVGAQGAWQDDRIDKISVKPGQVLVQVDIGLSPAGQFGYRGAVTDASGIPLPEAAIVLGYSYHKVPDTWGDYHTFERASTSRAGQYEIRVDTPWVRFIRAEKDGYKSSSYVSELDEGTAGVRLNPGRYDFKLQKAAPAQGEK